MSTKVFKIYGLQRTKSNYLQKFMQINYEDILVLSNVGGWKHGFVKREINWSGEDWEETIEISKQYHQRNLLECAGKKSIVNEAYDKEKINYLFTFRNPYSTYISRKKHMLGHNNFLENFVDDWNIKNRHYVDFCKNYAPLTLGIRFEDFVDINKQNIYEAIANIFELRKKHSMYQDIKNRIDPRVHITNVKFIEPALNSSALTDKEKKYFRKNLDEDLMNKLNYGVIR